MKHAALASLPLLLTLALLSDANAAPPRAAALGRASFAESPRELQSDALRRPQRPYTSGPADVLYVANAGTNAITIYRRTATGNTAPLGIISGPNTQLNDPGQLSQDAAGNVYVANGLNGTNPSILVFAHGAQGNVAPIRVLAGPLTQLHDPTALTVDQTTGKLFVFDEVPKLGGASVLLRFPPDASGNVAPFARSGPGLSPALEVASDASGQFLIEAHTDQCCSVASQGLTVMAKQFPDGGYPTIVADISAFQTGGVVDDPTTRTYVTTSAAMYRFDERTNGRGAIGGPASFTPAPVSIVTSDTCGGQLALGYERELYVVHSRANTCAADAVVVYAHDARANALPLRVLTGSATQLSLPTGIYEGH